MPAWNRLLQFPISCLRLPARDSDHALSLTRKVKEMVNLEEPPTDRTHQTNRPDLSNPDSHFSRLVTRKIEFGDLKGAIRLVSPNDRLAVSDEDTYSALKDRHPAPHPDTCILSPPVMADLPFQVSPKAVLSAIRSFPKGSAGGPDRLLPQHLKDLLQDQRDGSTLLAALTNFCTLVLKGDIPLEVRPFFFGASLVALQKESGGVRPIAVGCTLCRLSAKVASRTVLDDMAELLSPRQLGYGVRGGAEAAGMQQASRLVSRLVSRMLLVSPNI